MQFVQGKERTQGDCLAPSGFMETEKAFGLFGEDKAAIVQLMDKFHGKRVTLHRIIDGRDLPFLCFSPRQ